MNLINGWIFINKPSGITSFDVIRNIKKIINIKKIGHAGTLDPFATGMLGIALGEATKTIQFFSSIKQYEFEIEFGESKDTDDIFGKTTKITEVIPNIDAIKNCIPSYIGEINQVPPNFSAVKVQGRRAYNLARKNEKFVLKHKKVNIYGLECTKQNSKNRFSFKLDCSSGTYVRALARDIAKDLGSLGFVLNLRRTRLGRFTEKDLISLEKFKELVHIGDHFDYVHTIQDVLDDIPAVYLDYEIGQKFQNGLSLDYISNCDFFEPLLILSDLNVLGVGKINKGKLNPIRVFNR
jgi:tRNA pseudouridine55 synthase